MPCQPASPLDPTMVLGTEVMMMLQRLIADAREMEAESSAAEGEAQKDYETFGKDQGWTMGAAGLDLWHGWTESATA
eukprot:Skav215089  [mRNA]  locus=scaffold1068:70673:70903:+ [translate_table: standard]